MISWPNARIQSLAHATEGLEILAGTEDCGGSFLVGFATLVVTYGKTTVVSVRVFRDATNYSFHRRRSFSYHTKMADFEYSRVLSVFL